MSTTLRSKVRRQQIRVSNEFRDPDTHKPLNPLRLSTEKIETFYKFLIDEYILKNKQTFTEDELLIHLNAYLKKNKIVLKEHKEFKKLDQDKLQYRFNSLFQNLVINR